MVSPVLPYNGITHAGGLYLSRLHEALVAAGAEVTFLVDGTNEFAVGRPGAPDRVVVLGVPLRKTFHGRVAARVLREVEKTLRTRNPTWPRLPFLAHLLASPTARAAVRRADVVDLQWPETARLVPWVRRLNPRARILVTLHDVLSQRWSRRRTGADEHKTHVARRAESSAHRLERATIKRADAVLVFSDKDRRLLINSAADSCGKLELVDPPLSFGEPVRHKPSLAEPVVVFVGLLSRPENEDAALWLVRHVWPMVRREAPEARLHVVGADATDRLIEATGGDGTVQLMGFVEDLGAVYAGASVCAIPLRLGAGVKFKTVEALIAGVPTVTTSVGAEGIAGPEKFAGFADDAEGFADGVAWVLRNPEAADQLARQAQSWACANYDARRFALAVGRIYGVSA